MGIAEADPDDIDKQLRVIVDKYNHIRFERNDGHFDQAVALIRPTLAKLLSLRREGKLEGQPRFGEEFIEELTDQLAYCAAAPRALEDLEFARSRPPELACRLLELGMRTAAAKGDGPGVLAMARAVCSIPLGDQKQLVALAIACSTCVAGLDTLPVEPASDAGRAATSPLLCRAHHCRAESGH